MHAVMEHIDTNLNENQRRTAETYSAALDNQKSGVLATRLGALKGSTKKFGRNSVGYNGIIGTLDSIDKAMDVLVTDDMFDYLVANLNDGYIALEQKCQDYLDTHSSHRFTAAGKARVELVRRVLANGQAEHSLFLSQIVGYEDFGNGITIRQILAGMQPLQAVAAEASEFSVPGRQVAEEEVAQNAGVVTIQMLQDRLRGDTTVSGNIGAMLGIILETLDRARVRAETDIMPDIIQRINNICMTEPANETLTEISEYSTELGARMGLQPVANVDYPTFNGQTKIEPDAIAPEKFDDLHGMNNAFPEYRHLEPAVARYLASQSQYNTGALREHIYGDKRKTLGESKGYVLTSHSNDINAYLRTLNAKGPELEQNKLNKDFAALRTIGMLDKASQSSYLPEKTRLHRMLGASYLTFALGLKDENDKEIQNRVPTNVVGDINRMAGTVITDSGFMCTGYGVDLMFAGSPAMLTLLCDEGTPIFATGNHAESEIILGRNTSYMILGAKMHDISKISVPVSHGQVKDQGVANQEMMASYGGLEIIAKVLKKGNGPEQKGQTEEQMGAFKEKQTAYQPRFNGDHGDGVHREAYLEMSKRDASSLDGPEAAAMDEYTHDSGAINTRLRGGAVEHDKLDAQIFAMKKAFASHELPTDMETYRGVSDGFLTFLISKNSKIFENFPILTPEGKIDHEQMEKGGAELFVGISFVDNAFISTSTNKAFAQRWANMVRHNEELDKYKSATDAASVELRKEHQFPNNNTNIDGAHVLNMRLPQGTRAMFTDTMYTREGRARGQDEVTVDGGYAYVITGVKRVGKGMYEMDVSRV